MSTFTVSTCKGCGAGQIWAVSPKGANIPIDATQYTKATLDISKIAVYRLEQQGRIVQAIKLDKDTLADDQPFYVGHHATCAHVKDFSGQGRKKV